MHAVERKASDSSEQQNAKRKRKRKPTTKNGTRERERLNARTRQNKTGGNKQDSKKSNRTNHNKCMHAIKLILRMIRPPRHRINSPFIPIRPIMPLTTHHIIRRRIRRRYTRILRPKICQRRILQRVQILIGTRIHRRGTCRRQIVVLVLVRHILDYASCAAAAAGIDPCACTGF